MQVKLLAFASAAAALGWRERIVECEAEETPAGILQRIAPGFDVGKSRVAVNQEYARWDSPVGGSAEEIAVIPPVSGG